MQVALVTRTFEIREPPIVNEPHRRVALAPAAWAPELAAMGHIKNEMPTAIASAPTIRVPLGVGIRSARSIAT